MLTRMIPAPADPPTSTTFFLGQLSERTWPGSLSTERGPLDGQALTRGLDEWYVQVNQSAPSRCIDGRHDPALDENHLGAQTPGGATGSALAYRIGVDTDDLTRGTFVNDAEAMIDTYLRLGMAPGGHRDEVTMSGVGCGAIDGLDKVLECLTDPSLVEDHKRLTRTLLGPDFDRDTYLRVLGGALVLRSRADGYFAGRGDILDLLERKAPGSVSVLQGHHREDLVIVNLVPGTTLSSNRFARDHDGRQAFGYDLWRSRQMAYRVLPLPSQQVQRQRFVTGRVMISVATLMVLTDGSLPLLMRLPAPDPAAGPEQSVPW